MNTNYGMSKKFEVNINVHQEQVLSPFRFVMEALANEIREGLPWKIL